MTMPQAAPPRKRRPFILLPLVLVVLGAAAWSGWWVYGSRHISQRLDAQAKAGGAVGWTSYRMAGFPFRYFVTVEGFHYGRPGGLTVATDKLMLEAAAYDPTKWVGAAPGPVKITAPGRNITLSGDPLRFSISHPGESPPRISVEGVKMKIDGDLPFSAVDRFELHLSAKPEAKADFFLRIDHATAKPDSLLSRISPGNSIVVGLEGDVVNAPGLRGATLKDALAGWAAAGGAFNVRQGGLQAGQALLSLKPSTLFPATDGHVNGELALALTNGSDAMLAMGAVGALPSETAAVASGVAQAGSLFTAPGKALNLTFKFRDGRTSLEGVPLGPSPRLF